LDRPEYAICANCVFYQQANSGKHGYCRESPPVFTNLDPETGFAKFWHPVVGPHAWCGRFAESWED